MKQRVSKKNQRLSCICLFLALLLAGLIFICWTLEMRNIRQAVTVEAGALSVDANAFLIRDLGISASLETDLSQIDLNCPGDYPVQIRYQNHLFDATLQVRDTIAPTATLTSLTVLSVNPPAPEDFILSIQDVTIVTVRFAREPDMSIEGDQAVTLLLTDESGNTASSRTTLTVLFDKKPPVIEGVAPITIYRNHEVDYFQNVTVSDDHDETPELTIDDSRADLTRGGEYEIEYIARDDSGNEARVSTTLTVIADDTPPTILGVNPISLYAGSTVAYRRGILVVDDLDENPVLTVDSSQVNLSQPGTYELIYKATDAAGNESSISTTVTVKEKTDKYVDEETIYAAADAILAKIITDGMTDREKVEAIYKWARNNCHYISYSDKTDYLQAAYTIMTTHYGDCFNYYSMTRLFFDRLGIPNISVRRSADSVRTTSHYWSMVSVDGGLTYYHFDATPHSGTTASFCLVTDAYLDNFNKTHPGYYTRDTSLYPATPEA